MVVEAIQLAWKDWSEVCDFVPKPWFEGGVFLDEAGQVVPGFTKRTNKKGLKLNTFVSGNVAGSLLATEGDWIIKAVNFYPCKPGLFAALYEEEEVANA